MKRSSGSSSRDVRSLLAREQQRAVLERQLRRGRQLERVERVERALRERRERPQRLDLDVEHLDPHGAIGGRAEDVEQAAADRELAAVVDLRHALVAHLDERRGKLVEIEQVAASERDPVRAQRRVGDLLRQRRRRGDEHGRRRPVVAALEQGVERRDPQPDEVRRRLEVRLVGDAARRVEAHPTRPQPGAEVAGELAGGAIVGGDDDGGSRLIRMGEQRGDQERAQRRGAERLAAVTGERESLIALREVVEQWCEH